MNGEDEKFLFETIFPMSSVAGRIQFIDNWIFFGVENEDNEYSYDLYRVKLDGTEMSLVSDADDPLFTYEIEEEWIYYPKSVMKVGFQLWRMYHDGTNKQSLMSEFAFALDYNDTEIFYIDIEDGVLYALDRVTSEKRKVTEFDFRVHFITVVDEWVYYIAYGRGFYKVSINGGEHIMIQVLSLPPEKKIWVADNWLIYLSDLSYYEMVRISDKYDTDERVQQMVEEMAQSLSDGLQHEIEIRKYE